MIKELKTESREEWLALRKQYIGGSDAAAVVGLNPYVSRYSLWAEKTGKLPEFEGNTTTKVGAYLEQFVAQMFEEETGKKVRRKNATMVNDAYPFACADVDRMVVGENAILEIKTTNSYANTRRFANGEYPEQYYSQCVHYMAVTGAEKAYLAVLSECRDFHVFEIERDEGEIKALMDAEREFYELIKTDAAPAPDGSDSTSDAISKLYPNSDDTICDIEIFDRDLNEYAEIKQQIKALTELADEKTNKVKAFMCEAGSGIGERWKISYKTQERKTLDSKRLAEEHPEIDLDGYYKVSTSRVFKVTERKI